ncbi:hypothetical protein FHT86_000858 [Rhizobium sp. BK313]|uniref:hypothetical protein n=1 Tax=Rhizobium sp. BK313 TaxID=2587081 RepID=UPI0018513FF2|nr:hypothetical protein [Rhizobium sp. BK313]
MKAEVDKHVRGWERSNDHEFVWIELCRLTCEEEDAQMTDSGCRGGMRLKLEDFIDGFVAAGANQKDTFEAIAAEIENMRVSYERELDPADDDAAIVDEPSNDCPTDD